MFHLITCAPPLISGLFSPVDGIEPKIVAPMKVSGLMDLHDQILKVPSLISVLRAFGVATYPSIEIVSLLGALAALFCFISTRFCLTPMFGFMWVAYYSLVGITGTFHTQADDLLLEAGFIALMLSSGISCKMTNPSDIVYMIIMRFVLFR